MVKSQKSQFTEKDIKIDNSASLTASKFSTNYKTKYTSNEFKYEASVNEQSLWERFKEWLWYWFQKIFGITSSEKSEKYKNIAEKVIAGLIIGYVVYLIAKLILNKEGQWVFGKSTTKKIYHDDEIEKNIIHVNFEKLIKETSKKGDNRLIVRYYYLWVLKQLSEKDLIDWHPDKTNTDYLYELQSGELKTDFEHLSYLYNYIWYGEFELSEHTFLHAKNSFEKTLKSIGI